MQQQFSLTKSLIRAWSLWIRAIQGNGLRLHCGYGWGFTVIVEAQFRSGLVLVPFQI